MTSPVVSERNAVKPLPCPFCGRPAVGPMHDGKYTCSKPDGDDCPAHMWVPLEAWNRRASPVLVSREPTQDVVKEYGEAVRAAVVRQILGGAIGLKGDGRTWTDGDVSKMMASVQQACATVVQKMKLPELPASPSGASPAAPEAFELLQQLHALMGRVQGLADCIDDVLPELGEPLPSFAHKELCRIAARLREVAALSPSGSAANSQEQTK